MSKRYAVWGNDKTYRWLWMAVIAAGIKAAKERLNQSGQRAVKSEVTKNVRK